MTEENIDNLYRSTFGADFAKLDPEARDRADRLVMAAHSPPYVFQNGQWTQNPARQQLDALVASGRFTPQLAQQLGVYAAWKAGTKPSEGPISDLTLAKARQAGVPADKLKIAVEDRKAQIDSWAKDTVNRFAHLVPRTEKAALADENSIKLETPKAKRPKTMPQQAAAAPPGQEGAPIEQSAPVTPQAIQPAPNQSVQPAEPELGAPAPTNWTKQQLVNGQYVPME